MNPKVNMSVKPEGAQMDAVLAFTAVMVAARGNLYKSGRLFSPSSPRIIQIWQLS